MDRLNVAHTSSTSSAEAARELLDGLRVTDPACVVFFASIDHDGDVLGRALCEKFPNAQVVGCSTNGEFSSLAFGKGGAVAMAFPRETVSIAAATLLELGDGIERGARAASDRLSDALGRPLRSLDPSRHIGLALLEGATLREEKINEALGNIAPYLSFVGGSAGDDIAFRRTWAFANGAFTTDGCALLVMAMRGRFGILKTCNFVATERKVVVTKSIPDKRLILELNGEPAAPYYASAIGVPVDKIGIPEFLANPLGLMIDGEPWLRSGVRVVDGDALFFACSVVSGMTLSFMRSTDLIEDTRIALEKAEAKLGAPIGGAVLFNCAYRMIETQLKKCEPQYHAMLSRIPHVGMHTNGESWLGHINQTLTGIVFE